MVKLVSSWIRETMLNLQFEMMAFLLHRLTGLGIVFYIFAHLFSLGQRLISEAKYNETMKLYDNPLFHVGEWLLFIMCVFHAVNGLRIIAVDFFPLTRSQRILIFWVVAICAILAGFSMLFFFPAIRQMFLIS
ncbi:MAG: hypothetical protein Kow00107_03580 [Planctomycetota bacterium]